MLILCRITERVRLQPSISMEHLMVREGSRIMRTVTLVVRREPVRNVPAVNLQTIVIR